MPRSQAKRTTPRPQPKRPKTSRRSRARAIAVELRASVALVTLSRPDAHNALGADAIGELTAALAELGVDREVRAIILLGAGESFCAGMDLRQSNPKALVELARAWASLLDALDTLRTPTIARVHGAARGAGVGLVACCDIAVATQDATFALNETHAGLICAIEAPFIVAAIGPRHARRYAVSAETLSAAEAFRVGLVHDLAPNTEQLDARINEMLASLLLAAPDAQAASKALVRELAGGDAKRFEKAGARFASAAASAEAREAIEALRKGRTPGWLPREWSAS